MRRKKEKEIVGIAKTEFIAYACLKDAYGSLMRAAANEDMEKAKELARQYTTEDGADDRVIGHFPGLMRNVFKSEKEYEYAYQMLQDRRMGKRRK